MFRNTWKMKYAFLLLAVSLLLYLVHFFIFQDPAFIFRLMINNLAFAPISVLFVTLFINEIMERRNRQERVQRTYLALGTFFSEMGSEILARISAFDPDREIIEGAAEISENWKDKDFKELQQSLSDREICLDCGIEHLESLAVLLAAEKDQLAGMLANPALKEHDYLTDMLWSVYHLGTELMARKELEKASEKDLDHLRKDLERAYRLLCIEWIEYMKHLKDEYPYLFSFAARTNPFRTDSKAAL